MKNPKLNLHLDFLFNLALSQPNTQLRTETIKQFVQITKRNQVRISQDIKRNLCFKCYEILIPSVTSCSRMIKSMNGLFLEIKCNCGNVKRFCFKGEKGVITRKGHKSDCFNLENTDNET